MVRMLSIGNQMSILKTEGWKVRTLMDLGMGDDDTIANLSKSFKSFVGVKDEIFTEIPLAGRFINLIVPAHFPNLQGIFLSNCNLNPLLWLPSAAAKTKEAEEPKVKKRHHSGGLISLMRKFVVRLQRRRSGVSSTATVLHQSR